MSVQASKALSKVHYKTELGFWVPLKYMTRESLEKQKIYEGRILLRMNENDKERMSVTILLQLKENIEEEKARKQMEAELL